MMEPPEPNGTVRADGADTRNQLTVPNVAGRQPVRGFPVDGIDELSLRAGHPVNTVGTQVVDATVLSAHQGILTNGHALGDRSAENNSEQGHYSNKRQIYIVEDDCAPKYPFEETNLLRAGHNSRIHLAPATNGAGQPTPTLVALSPDTLSYQDMGKNKKNEKRYKRTGDFDSEISRVQGRINLYTVHKTATQGVMNIAQFSMNISQLKKVLDAGSASHYFYLLVISICISLTTQIAVGILLLLVGSHETKPQHEMTEHKIKKAVRTNRYAVLLLFVVSSINILISVFYASTPD